MAAKKANQAVTIGGYDDAKWRAEDDMRTLARAKEIEADRKRMMAAQKMAKEKMSELQKVVSKAPAKMTARKK